MKETLIKETLEKFRVLAKNNLNMNRKMALNLEMSIKYYTKNYKPYDLVKLEIQAIEEATVECFQIFGSFYKNVKFDSSIYALCALGAAYGADKYMYDNGIRKAIHPTTILANDGMTDNDIGEIKAFKKLCLKFGYPRDI